MQKDYDIIVVGGGHAGCEAALAAARLGCCTALITSKLDAIAIMPCNPSIGGLAKSHLTVDLDVLGGEMALNADCTGLQYRCLNSSRGPAVKATRIQCDKGAYAGRMQKVLRSTPGLDLVEDNVADLIHTGEEVSGIVTNHGESLSAGKVILANGTALDGSIHVGAETTRGAGDGRPAMPELSRSLRAMGFNLKTLKTGTPPRIAAGSVNWSKVEPQPSDHPLPFLSWRAKEEMFHVEHDKHRFHPWTPGTHEKPCYITRTTGKTHQIIRDNLARSSRYGGYITAVGVRYCPSIEDKVVKFSGQDSHLVYLEPESLRGESIYLNGVSNSFPAPLQNDIIHSIPGLEEAETIKYGYAIVYSAIDPRSLDQTLESRQYRNLYFAGQINGTTGYEEAAAQGFMAGVNAALSLRQKASFVLSRQESYIGVMIDDLTLKGTDEPYRMFTSRAERRLILRADNARYRLLEATERLGLSDIAFNRNSRQYMSLLKKELERLGQSHDRRGVSALGRLAQGGMAYYDLAEANAELPRPVAEQIEIHARYRGYIEREQQAADRARAEQGLTLPENVNYMSILALRYEAREKLQQAQPSALGQASRIPGVNPADISILTIMLKNKTLPRQ